MDGIIDELLRLEDAKHQALIGLDPTAYDRSVRQQTVLLDDSRLALEARQGADKLLAFSKLANLNTSLYKNLLTTMPWLVAQAGYTGTGILAGALAPRRVSSFSMEA
jgi:hypothetical protein